MNTCVSYFFCEDILRVCLLIREIECIKMVCQCSNNNLMDMITYGTSNDNSDLAADLYT